MRVVDHRVDSDAIGQFERGDVSGLRQRSPQRDRTLEFAIVVVRGVWAGCGLKCYRRIHNRVVGAASLVDHGGVYVGLKRRSDLAQSLRGAVEFREIEIAAANHGLDFSGRVIDGDERSFGSGVLLQADLRFSVGIEREHFEVDDVARVENVGQLELGPGDIGLRQRGGAPSEMHLGSAR